LKKNIIFEGFSGLARAAILDFISKHGDISISPILKETAAPRPSFLWDYDLTEGQIREILSGPLDRRKWLVARILEHARFDEIWRYLTLSQIERDLAHLRLPAKVREHWEFAIRRWKKAA